MDNLDRLQFLHECINHLIPSDKRCAGYSFGITVVALSDLLMGKLDDFVATYKFATDDVAHIKQAADGRWEVAEYIESIKSESHDKYSEIEGFCDEIAVAQMPHLYKKRINNEQITCQADLFKALLDMRFLQREIKNLPSNLGRVSIQIDYKRMGNLLKGMQKVADSDGNSNFIFLISYMSHTIGCGYDSKIQKWVLINTKHFSLISQFYTLSGAMQSIQTALSGIFDRTSEHSVVCVEAVHSNNNQKIASLWHGFVEQELSAIMLYKSSARLGLFVNAKKYLADVTINRMHEMNLIDEKATYKSNVIQLLKTDKDLLTTAINKKQDDIVRGMLANFPPDDLIKLDSNGQTPLICAILTQQDKIAIHLICNDFKHSLTGDTAGRLPLYHAIMMGNEKIIQLLFEKTSVMPIYAVLTLDKMMLNKIIDKPYFDIHQCNDRGNSVLHYAAYYGRAEAVELLLSKPRLQTNVKNMDGDTPYELARRASRQKICELLAPPQFSGSKRRFDHLDNQAAPGSWGMYFNSFGFTDGLNEKHKTTAARAPGMNS